VLVVHLPGVAEKPLQDHARAVAADFGLGAADVSVIEVPAIPRTDTGKVKRGEITRTYGTAPVAAQDAPTATNDVMAIFVSVFGDAARDEDMSFASLGGDSLNYVMLSVALGKVLPRPPEGWETMPIGTLAQMAAESERGSSALHPVDTNVLVRALAITGIVSSHADLADVGGGAHLLMMLVGYNLARFRGPSMLAGRVWSNIAAYLRKILIPYFLLNAAYMLWTSDWHLSGLLGYSNLVGPGSSPSLFPQWFVQILLQTVLIVGVILSAGGVRRSIMRHPFETMTIGVIASMAASQAIQFLWSSDALYNRVPWVFLPLILLAWLMTVAKTPQQRALVTILLLVETFFEPINCMRFCWVIVGGVLVCWVPYIPVPKFLRAATAMIAAAVFYIYLFHEIFLHAVYRVLHLRWPVAGLVVGLCGPIAVWWVFEQSGLVARVVKAVASKVRGWSPVAGATPLTVTVTQER